MNKLKVGNKSFPLLVFFGIVLFFIFLILVFNVVTKTSILPTNFSDEPAIYYGPEGQEVLYDPNYFTPEEVEEVFEYGFDKDFHDDSTPQPE